MKEFRLFLRKFSFAIGLTLFGLFLVIATIAAQQNALFLYGGVLILLLGVFGILMAGEVVKGSALNFLVYVFLPFVLITGYLVYRSIQEPLEFDAVKKTRYELVKNNLMAIKDLQLAHKAVKGNYAKDFNELFTFMETDSFPVVKSIGSVPDTLTEAEALKLGLIKRDTIPLSVGDSLSSKFAKDYSIADPRSIENIPFTDGKKITLEAGEIERGKVKVPVFAATVKNETLFPDWDKHFYQDEKDLQIGSMSEPITSGNWQ